MANSILEAVKMRLWDFQPLRIDYSEIEASDNMPGTREKLDILAEHLRRDAVIWDSDDRRGDDCPKRQGSEDWPRRRRPR